MSERINGARNGKLVNWVAFGLVFLIQTFTAGWIISDLSARLGAAERAIERRSSHPLRIGVLEDRWRTITAALDEIKRDLKTVLQKRAER